MSSETETIPQEIIEIPIVRTLLQCSLDNLYGCSENLLLELAALVSVGLGAIALKTIIEDRNKILELWDKVIVCISFASLSMLILFFGFWNTQMWQFSIRTLFFCNSILICNTVFKIHEPSEEAKQNIAKAVKGTFAYLFGLWFFCGFLHKNTPDAPYNCTRIDWLLISGSNLIVSCIQAYATLGIIQSISGDTNQDQVENDCKEEGDNKKMQLSALMIGIFFPNFVQFLWDYVAHTHSSSVHECNEYFFSSSFLTFLLFLILKLICFFVGPWSIYYAFYWKNRSYINTAKNDPNGQYFFDCRSDIIEKYTF